MNIITIFVLVIMGIVLYNIFSNSGNKNKKQVRRGRQVPNRRSIDQRRNQFSDQNLIRGAQREVNRGNFDAAADLYLRANQVFTAAKMKLFKGPQAAPEALDLIRVNAPQRYNIILDNLVNEFYYRLKKPKISIALLRNAGMHERAEAIEVATGMNITQKQEPVITTSAPKAQPKMAPMKTEVPKKEFDLEDVKPVTGDDLDNFLDSSIPKSQTTDSVTTSQPLGNISNSLLMSSGTMNENCLVCRKSIDSGDTFIYCLNCGKPGHYKHLAEMLKVTGRCPGCKKSLRMKQYDLN